MVGRRWLKLIKHVLVFLPFVLFDVICQQEWLTCVVSIDMYNLYSPNTPFAPDIQGPKQFHLQIFQNIKVQNKNTSDYLEGSQATGFCNRAPQDWTKKKRMGSPHIVQQASREAMSNSSVRSMTRKYSWSASWPVRGMGMRCLLWSKSMGSVVSQRTFHRWVTVTH